MHIRSTCQKPTSSSLIYETFIIYNGVYVFLSSPFLLEAPCTGNESCPREPEGVPQPNGDGEV